MKKEELMALGLDEEMATKVAAASAEELKGFIPKARFDEVNGEKKQLETVKATLEGQLETLKNSTGDVEAMKKQINQLQADNKAKDEAHASEIKQLKVDSAVEAAINAAGGRNAKAIKALLNDLDKAELLEDGKVKGLDEQITALSKADDSSFLFTANSKPQLKGIQPGESGDDGTGGGTPPDMSKMTYDQLKDLLESQGN